MTHYLKKFAAENKVSEAKLTPAAMVPLLAYAWPGNIRELRNACENLAVLQAGKVVEPKDLDPRFMEIPVAARHPSAAGVTALPPGVFDKEQNEKNLLKQALASAAGNRTKAAESLGISRRTLHRKLLQWPELEAGATLSS